MCFLLSFARAGDSALFFSSMTRGPPTFHCETLGYLLCAREVPSPFRWSVLMGSAKIVVRFAHYLPRKGPGC